MSKRKFWQETKSRPIDALIQLVGGLGIAIVGLFLINLLAGCSTTPPVVDEAPAQQS